MKVWLSLLISFCYLIIYAVINSFIEAALYNKSKLKPLNGKEKYKMYDFLISNILFTVLFCVLLGVMFIVLGFQDFLVYQLFLYVIISFLSDHLLLRKKVEKGERIFIPLKARLESNVLLFLLGLLMPSIIRLIR